MKGLKSTLLFFIGVCFAIGHAQAQFLGGFFSQQSQKEKFMAEQIVGYQVYLGAIKIGYNITQNGWSSAFNLKNGTFGLHTDYFNSLQQVAPVIKSNPKGRAIDSLYLQACSLFANEKQWQQKQQLLTADELQYFTKVQNNIQSIGQQDIDELTQVLTPGKLQMTDAERLNRLDKLYNSMKDKYAFAGYFTAKCRKLALQRQQQTADKAQLKQLYGIQ